MSEPQEEPTQSQAGTDQPPEAPAAVPIRNPADGFDTSGLLEGSGRLPSEGFLTEANIRSDVGAVERPGPTPSTTEGGNDE
jgi:hypothetical protein